MCSRAVSSQFDAQSEIPIAYMPLLPQTIYKSLISGITVIIAAINPLQDNPFGQISQHDLHKYCLNKILILCTLFTLLGIVRLTALWSNGIQALSDWQRSDPMAYRHCQIDSALIQWHTGIVRLTALWSNGIQASSDWQHSDPMAYRHCQIDSALIQWHTGIVRLTALWSNGIQASSDWQHSDPMAYRHRQIDSTLVQWHTGIVRLTALWSNGIQASSDWQRSRPMMLGIQWGSSHISGWPCHSLLQQYVRSLAPLQLVAP